jgi:hypothetical protein
VFNAVMIAQSVLTARYRLDIQDAVPALAETLGPPAALKKERRNPRLTRLRALGDTRLTVEGLRTWLDVLTPWIERAVQAERRTEDAEAAMQRLQSVAQQQEERIEQLEDEKAAALRYAAQLSAEIEERRERERGASLARRHEASQLRGTMAGFLDDDVLPLLTAAREGLELAEPRVPFALERLEDAVHEIEGRVRWLRSSD